MTRAKNNEANNKTEQERYNELNEKLEENARLLDENKKKQEEVIKAKIPN